MTDTEIAYVVSERGNGNAGGNRFVDATGFVLYRIGDLNSRIQIYTGTVRTFEQALEPAVTR